MSSTLYAPYKHLGEGGDYPIEVNFGIRIYDNKGEKLPAIGESGASLKGGLRTNHIGAVPLLDGEKKKIGTAEVIRITSAKPENIDIEDYNACGFGSIEEATEYVQREHSEEFERDGIVTVFYFMVKSLDTDS